MFAQKFFFLLVALVAIQIFIVDADRTVSTVNSTQTWYTCSGDQVQDINYNVTLLNGIQTHVNDIGQEVAGYNTTAPGAATGFLVALLNQTELQNYINPAGPLYTDVSDASCIQSKPPYQPFNNCSANTQLGPPGIFCLAVTNPGPQEISFQLDLVWTYLNGTTSGKSSSTSSSGTPSSSSPSSSSSSSASSSPTSTKSGVDSLVVNVSYTLVFIGLTTLVLLSLSK